MSDRPVTRTEGEVLELLQALIRNRCVNDGSPASGHEARSVATLEAYFGASGEVVEPAPDRQSVVYRIPGSDPAAPCLLLMGHLDVVPVTEEGWSVDPFGAEVIDERGVLGNLVLVYAELIDDDTLDFIGNTAH